MPNRRHRSSNIPPSASSCLSGGAPAAPAARLAGWLLAALARAWRRHRHRRAALALLDFDDHRLADIGLSRADIRGSVIGRVPRQTPSGAAGRPGDRPPP